MRDFLIAFVAFGFSSTIVLAFGYYAVSMQTIQQLLALLIVGILIAVNMFYRTMLQSHGKWFLLFVITFIVQLLVIATGGFSSPFFILFYLLAFGVSILFSLNISVLYLAFSFWVLIGTMLFDQQARVSFQHDPGAAILYGVSFIAIIPLTQLLAHKYKFKDKIMTMMTNQIEVEESIIEELNEMIFVTDKDATILSVNDAVVQTLRLSKSELVNHPLFSVLFLKDKDGKRITNETLALTTILKENTTKILSRISLLAISGLNSQQVSMRIKPVINLSGVVDQISFIISTTTQISTDPHKELEETTARLDGMVEEMKKNLVANNSSELHKFVLITQVGKDILTARTLEDHGIGEKKVMIDVAALCKQIVLTEKIFAQGFHVPLQFQINNFGEKDIAPLLSGGFSIESEQFTGPFFTAPCEFKYLSIAIQKLLDVAILLTSNEKNALVRINIEREKDTALLITITTKTPKMSEQEQDDLFTINYGALSRKTNLDLGSGLEGYLAKKIIDALNIPFNSTIDSEKNRISFALWISKK
ncbi:MAG: PAS domain-containing protein [Candidatus Levyibacteriota bacterium]